MTRRSEHGDKRHEDGAWRCCASTVLLLALLGVPWATQPVQATPHPGQSVNVAIISAPGVINGGTFPTGSNPSFAAFNFTNLPVANVDAANLATFDTVLLNVASSGMGCNVNTLSAGQKADLVNFAAAGNKLIIYDSECYPGPVDYSWLPYPFTTAKPGVPTAFGLAIVENNFLSTLVGDPSCLLGDPHCINAAMLEQQTDAVIDMNIMMTLDPNWCVDMSGTLFTGITWPAHTYAKIPTGTDQGLIIYNGLDVDYMSSSSVPSTTSGGGNLAKIWLQELEQPFDPSNLPCGIPVIGINVTPDTAENEVGEDHTVTATITDLLGNPQPPGILMTFTVVSGPNAGASGTCSVNADCTTDTNGEVSWTYTGSGGVGTDEIEGCFTDEAGNVLCDTVTKDWVAPPFTPVSIDIKPGSCPNSFNRDSNGVLPVAIVGTEDFDVTQIDPSTVEICSLDENGDVIGCIGPHEGPPGPHTVVEDVATPFDGEAVRLPRARGRRHSGPLAQVQDGGPGGGPRARRSAGRGPARAAGEGHSARGIRWDADRGQRLCPAGAAGVAARARPGERERIRGVDRSHSAR